MQKKAFLEGKLTAVSLAFTTLIQIPNLLSDLTRTADVFAESANMPLTYLTLVGAAGIIWGGFRRAFNYFK